MGMHIEINWGCTMTCVNLRCTSQVYPGIPPQCWWRAVQMSTCCLHRTVCAWRPVSGPRVQRAREVWGDGVCLSLPVDWWSVWDSQLFQHWLHWTRQLLWWLVPCLWVKGTVQMDYFTSLHVYHEPILSSYWKTFTHVMPECHASLIRMCVYT